MTTKTRRVVLFTLGMVAAWTVAALIGGQIAEPPPDQRQLDPGLPMLEPTLSNVLARALVAGVSSGLIASFLELRVLPRYASRLGVGTMLIARTVAYAAVGLLAVGATVRYLARRELGVSVLTVVTSDGFQDFLTGPRFMGLLATFVIASFVINGGIQVARLLGPSTLRQILVGRYVRPQHEERSFLFVDLANSTGIAETLGPLKFAEFKNDFFFDLAEPVLNARGQIVQYVGDEVMITWPVRRGRRSRSADCVRMFFELRDRIERRSSVYESRYGVVPKFRAGLHFGPVVVSELGDIKREIVFSGDAVNTAARIQALCRPLGHDFLASRVALEGIELPDRINSEDIGEHELRGRTEPVNLVSLGSAS